MTLSNAFGFAKGDKHLMTVKVDKDLNNVEVSFWEKNERLEVVATINGGTVVTNLPFTERAVTNLLEEMGMNKTIIKGIWQELNK